MGTIAGYGNIIMYFAGLVVFGFVYWLMDGILNVLKPLNLADTTTYTSYDLLLFFWYGIVVVYLLFGGIWLIRSFQKQSYGGMGP